MAGQSEQVSDRAMDSEKYSERIPILNADVLDLQ